MSHLPETKRRFDKDLLMTRILTEDSYQITTNDAYKYYNIIDKVVCFFNGKDWNIIKLDDVLAYPVLYYEFWSEKHNTTFHNSLVVCPITMRSMIYKGKIKIIDIIIERLYLLNTDTSDEFFMDLPYTGDVDEGGKEKKIKSHVKRHEVKILTLRDAYMFLIDPKYLVINKGLIHRPIIYDRYYTNRLNYEGYPLHTTLHPKTIVYMVQYYSHSMKRYRYTVIVGRDINRETVTGYSFKASGVWDFIHKHIHEFIKKKAYVYPIFWFMVEKLYPDVNMAYVM